MEELSIEEKAKAYDEALKYAKIYYTNGNEDMKMMMKTCFPTLVEESEDDRIRNGLIALLKFGLEDGSAIAPGFNETKEQALSWLEKQVPACLSHDDEIMIRQLTEYFTTGKGLQNTNDTVVEWIADIKRKLEKQNENNKLWQNN